ncbi:nuclear transport factor 2 family protein [Olivibacter domesticus]|uniref:DUF4440 domain-containing protein n=1 Tax=Olivibacter domesticus TaxID=407022 RepID=A0A1H7M6E1_OLID1|nr:nuclear transport factor 2 family protein [Olivibacter domesticus]SEL06754.1 protein of unknown function [Olivibacter domesticus]
MFKQKVVLLLAMMVTGTLVHSQSLTEKKLLKTVDELRQAMLNGNRKALDAIAADNLSYWHSGGNLEDKATFIESLASGKSDFVTLDLTDQTTTISNDVATVHHILTAKTNDGGKPGNVRIGVLLVFQKYGEDWKLFARQAFKLPTQ